MIVREILCSETKSACARQVLERLPDWFGDRQSLDEYVAKAAELPFWAAMNEKEESVGFFSVRTHYGHTGDLFVCETAPSVAYARTRNFYRSIGFEPLITLTEMWNEKNLCRIMIKTL